MTNIFKNIKIHNKVGKYILKYSVLWKWSLKPKYPFIIFIELKILVGMWLYHCKICLGSNIVWEKDHNSTKSSFCSQTSIQGQKSQK